MTLIEWRPGDSAPILVHGLIPTPEVLTFEALCSVADHRYPNTVCTTL
jgi:hypothetical protein